MSELARGRVSDRPWGLTLGALGIRGFTGILRLTSESKLFSIRFEDGAVIDATSSVLADSAARVAMSAELADATKVGEIVRLLALTPDRDELEVVREVCHLTPDQADQLRRRLIAQRAARTMSVTDGEFVVTTAPRLRPPTALDIRPLIYLGALVHLPAVRLEADLAGIGSRFRLKDDADAELPAYGFTPAEGRIVARLQDGATLAELEAAYPDLERRTISAVVYALVSGLACGAVETPVDAADAPRVASKVDPNTTFKVSKVDPNTTFKVRVKTEPAVPTQAPQPAAKPQPPAVPPAAPRRKHLDSKGPPIIERRATPIGRTKKPSIPGQRGMAIVERRSPRTPHVRDPRAATAPHVIPETGPFDDMDLARKSGVHAAVRPPVPDAEPLAGSPFDDIDLARRSAEMRAVAPPSDDATSDPQERGSISAEIEAAFEDVASKSGRFGRQTNPPPLGEPGFDATALDPNDGELDEPTVTSNLGLDEPTDASGDGSDERTNVVARPEESDESEQSEEPTAVVARERDGSDERTNVVARIEESEERTAVRAEPTASELDESEEPTSVSATNLPKVDEIPDHVAKRRTAAMWAQAPFDADQPEAADKPASPDQRPRPRTRTEQLLVFAAIPREPAKRDVPTGQEEPLRLDAPPRKSRAPTSSAWLPLELRAPAGREPDEEE